MSSKAQAAAFETLVPAPIPAKVREAMIREVENTFGLARHHLYTSHPLIRRKVKLHAYAQSLG